MALGVIPKCYFTHTPKIKKVFKNILEDLL
jgi:hypothetical protein